MTLFHSQHGEDRWIADRWTELGLSDHAWYIDVGAFDGIQYSNSKFLEDRGWDGICFEPDPRCWKELIASRTCLRAPEIIGRDNRPAVPFRLAGLGLSGTEASIHSNQVIDREQITLPAAIDRYNIPAEWVELLSIDTEGTELDVIAGMTGDDGRLRFTPKVVIIEYDTLRHPIQPPEKMRQIANDLIPRNYRWVHTTAGNMIFHLPTP